MIDIVLLVVGFSLGSFGYRIETMMEQGKTHARGKTILILLSLFSYFSLFILLILGIIVINWWITLLIFIIVGFIVGIAVHKIPVWLEENMDYFGNYITISYLLCMPLQY